MSYKIAKVAVEAAAYGFDKAFDYLIPDELENEVMVGCRVIVPFGRGNTKRQGFVFALSEKSDEEKLKKIAAVPDKAPLLNCEMLSLAVFLKQQTFCTLYDAAKACLPSGIGLDFVASYIALSEVEEDVLSSLNEAESAVFNYLKNAGKYVKEDKILKDLSLDKDLKTIQSLLKKGVIAKNVDTVRKVGDLTVKMARLTREYEDEEIPFKLTQKQKSVVNLLRDIGSGFVKEVCYFTGVTPAVVSTLVKRGVVELFDNEIYRSPMKNRVSRDDEEIILSDEQNIAFVNLLKEYNDSEKHVSLLYGVTGSGKTKVFLRLIDEVIKDGKGVIMMVPEISLTPQMLDLFYSRYGNEIAVFHSALSMGERLDEWKRVKNGEAKIALGTRSAVFAPFENLGLIIMDEEQEHTYKSEMSPRFHARDVAKFRTNYHNSLLLLASATPSVESYTYAKQGRYSLNVLTERYGNAVLPEVETIDTSRGENALAEGNLTVDLAKALAENYKNKKQSILLLNRRGYNTFASCTSCKTVMTCPNCSISLNYHTRNGRLMCHYCGYSTPFTDVCPSCGERSVKFSGTGTQKIEEELKEVLPEARILRLDTDTSSSRYAFENSLKAFADGEYDIIVGTQMVAKGLDFPSVTLVGVISVDQMLFNDDYKSAERTFSLLTQVVGRSGRGDEKGRAVIQTSFPENEIIRFSVKQDYDAFYNTEINIRKAMIYPPYCDICTVGFVSQDEVKASAASKYFLNKIKELNAEQFSDVQLIVLGPIAPHVAKVGGKYRFRIIIKCRNNKRTREMISSLLKDFASNSSFNGVSAIADMNPDTIF
ncbi:MAG: primosomal protein N' [Ruminococcaceae bacterium]|jgi:primosomal protein N' (replication factor Y)|nr:primosomal protein N' [Oscillospiraceae bacterium]